jgi:uncharacterized membrane protein
MHPALHIAHADAHWMAWNLTLAFVPFLLAAVLTRATWLPHLVRLPLWVLVIAFLPNAPYVWTDGLHLVRDIAVLQTAPLGLAVLLPLYAAYTVFGFLPYVLTLLLLERRMLERGLSRRVVTTCRMLQYVPVGIGIYLGRIDRFNSWDPFVHRHAFAATVRIQAGHPRAWAFTVLAIAILAATTEVARLVLLRATSRRSAVDGVPHVDGRRLAAFTLAASAYMAGALLAAAMLPALVLGAVHAPGWGSLRVLAAVACGLLLAGTAVVAYRTLALRRESMRASWTTVGLLTLAAPYVGGCVMLMFVALHWSISGGVPRYLGPERFW